jgi:hypothetical protein
MSDTSSGDTERIPYGDESEWTMSDALGDGMRDDADDVVLYIPRERETCHDCGVERGELHTKGCDVEQCPECHTQLISCDHAERYLQADTDRREADQ